MGGDYRSRGGCGRLANSLYPLHEQLWIPGGHVVADENGVISADRAPPAIYLRLGARQVAPLSAPAPADLDLPAALRPELTRLAAEFTAGAAGPEEQLLRIQARLQRGYRYARSFGDSGQRDPVLHFLSAGKTGHCESFASALALLGRALGVPTHVVTGFRVHERSVDDGHYKVRQRNAHAWVEAHLPRRGWTRFDPTPTSEREAEDAPSGSALLARVTKRWQGLRAALAGGLGVRLGGAAAGLLATWWIARQLLRRRRRSVLMTLPTPLPEFTRLCAALARAGLRRAPGETLEGFAARVPDLEAAALIRAYAALRYGGRGDEAALCAAMQVCARRLDAPRATTARGKDR